jgi:hypothetical protein
VTVVCQCESDETERAKCVRVCERCDVGQRCGRFWVSQRALTGGDDQQERLESLRRQLEALQASERRAVAGARPTPTTVPLCIREMKQQSV